MNTAHAAKLALARTRQDMLRAILPQDIAWGITVTKSGNIFMRDVLVARFIADGRIAADRHSEPVAATDSRALEARFRGVFFPADYTDPMTAYDCHEELRAAYVAGDDDAVKTALRRLEALKAPVAVA